MKERLAVYCTHCRMWFDTAKGWQAQQGPFGIPACPCCGAPLMEMGYNEFKKNNKDRDRLNEVMTWEYPNGSYWSGLRSWRPGMRHG